MINRFTAIIGAVVAFTLIVCVTFLIWAGKSTGDLIALIGTGIMPILVLMVTGKLNTIQQNTNGTTSELVAMVKALQAEVARRPLPPEGTPPGNGLNSVPN